MKADGARRPDIQGLRAVAVLAVMAYHAELGVPGGFAGVDVFFVISGFVITGMMLRELHTSATLSLTNFYLRRVKRLTPALALVVTTTLLLAIPFSTPFGEQQVAAKTALGAMFLLANAVIAVTSGGYFDGPADLNPLLHTWSLSVEEQFYLVVPALFWLSWRRAAPGRGWRAATALAAVLATLSGACALWGALSGAPPVWAGFYSPISRAWEFGVGVLLALLLHRRPLTASGRLLAAASGALGAAGLLSMLLGWSGSSSRWPGPWTLLPVLSSGALLVAGSAAAPGWVTRLLATGPMVRIGDLSYSLYLWHWPVIVLARNLWPDARLTAPMAVLVSVVPAVLSYRWVEDPLRRASWGGRQFLARVGVMVLVPSVAAALVVVGARAGWGVAPVVTTLNAARQGHVGWTDCLDLDPRTGPTDEQWQRCSWGPVDGRRVYLVGDSNAAQYIEAVLDGTPNRGARVSEATAAGCPFIDVYRNSGTGAPSASDLGCRQWYEDLLARLQQADPGTVVIGQSASQWLLGGRALSSVPAGYSTDFAARDHALRGGLTATIRALRSAGHHVVVVTPMVWFGESSQATVVTCRSLISLAAGSCPRSVNVSDLPSQVAVRRSVTQAARDAGATLMDLTSLQCPGGLCVSTVGDVPVYMDSGHYTAAFVETLGSQFAEAFAGVSPSPQTR